MRQASIAKMLETYNAEHHLAVRGETRPLNQQVFRIQCLRTFLLSGTPMNRLSTFRPLLEEHGQALTSNLLDYVTMLRNQEFDQIKAEIGSHEIMVIFDGTSVG